MELNYKILDQLSTKYGDSFYLLNSNIFRDNYVKSRESATIHKKLRELLGLSVDKKNFVFGNIKRPRVEQ